MLRRLSPASRLLRRDPTSAGPSAGRRRLLPAYRRQAGPRRPPRVRRLDVPPPSAPIPLRPRLDLGRRVPWHANPAGPACSGLHFRSMLGLAERLPPHTASRRRAWTAEAASLPCSCLRLPVATNSLRRGLAPPLQWPCLAHQGRCAPLTRWPEAGPSLTAAARAGTGRAQVGTEGWRRSNRRMERNRQSSGCRHLLRTERSEETFGGDFPRYRFPHAVESAGSGSGQRHDIVPIVAVFLV